MANDGNGELPEEELTPDDLMEQQELLRQSSIYLDAKETNLEVLEELQSQVEHFQSLDIPVWSTDSLGDLGDLIEIQSELVQDERDANDELLSNYVDTYRGLDAADRELADRMLNEGEFGNQINEMSIEALQERAKDLEKIEGPEHSASFERLNELRAQISQGSELLDKLNEQDAGGLKGLKNDMQAMAVGKVVRDSMVECQKLMQKEPDMFKEAAEAKAAYQDQMNELKLVNKELENRLGYVPGREQGDGSIDQLAKQEPTVDAAVRSWEALEKSATELQSQTSELQSLQEHANGLQYQEKVNYPENYTRYMNLSEQERQCKDKMFELARSHPQGFVQTVQAIYVFMKLHKELDRCRDAQAAILTVQPKLFKDVQDAREERLQNNAEYSRAKQAVIEKRETVNELKASHEKIEKIAEKQYQSLNGQDRHQAARELASRGNLEFRDSHERDADRADQDLGREQSQDLSRNQEMDRMRER